MNILFVSDVSICDVIGGAERVLFEQSTGMSQRGHNIHVLTRRLPDHVSNYEYIHGVHEWRYDFHQRIPAISLKTMWLNANRLFKFLQKKHHFDCINFHQPFSAFGINFSKISSFLPKIYTCHSLSFEEFSSRYRNGNGILCKASKFLQIQARKKIERYGLSKSHVVVVLSRFTKEKLVDVYNMPVEKIETIPGGADLKKFHPGDDKAALRRQLKIPQDKVILFSLRNLVPRMGLENLIIAFHESVKKADDIQLVIGGEGPLQSRLIDLARSLGVGHRVHFTGFISEELLPLYYQMADLFVLPTKELEGFGLVTLEAMACGLPVVGTPVGGTKEILGKFDSNFLFQNSGSEAITKLIIEKYQLIKEYPQRWKQISIQSRKFVQAHYSWKQNIDSIEQLFQSQLDIKRV